MSIGKICNRMVVFVKKSDSIREAAVIMRKYHVGDVVVIEEREEERFPIGILTDRDIVMQLTAEDVDIEAVTVGDHASMVVCWPRILGPPPHRPRIHDCLNKSVSTR